MVNRTKEPKKVWHLDKKNTVKLKFIPQPLNCLGNGDVETFQSTLFSPINFISSKKELTMGKQTIQ